MTAPATNGDLPLLEVDGISKYFGTVIALQDISMGVRAGEVMCVLGDNGAGKSTLIKILSGVHQPDEGHYLIEGEKVRFASPRDALARGIATVYQDLAIAPGHRTAWRPGPERSCARRAGRTCRPLRQPPPAGGPYPAADAAARRQGADP